MGCKDGDWGMAKSEAGFRAALGAAGRDSYALCDPNNFQDWGWDGKPYVDSDFKGCVWEPGRSSCSAVPHCPLEGSLFGPCREVRRLCRCV